MNPLTYRELYSITQSQKSSQLCNLLLDLTWDLINAAGGIPSDETEARNRLKETMLYESQRRFSAGWACDLEWDLWSGVEEGREPYLRLLSEAAGGWFRWVPNAGEYGEPVFVQATEWGKVYATGHVARSSPDSTEPPG